MVPAPGPAQELARVAARPGPVPGPGGGAGSRVEAWIPSLGMPLGVCPRPEARPLGRTSAGSDLGATSCPADPGPAQPRPVSPFEDRSAVWRRGQHRLVKGRWTGPGPANVGSWSRSWMSALSPSLLGQGSSWEEKDRQEGPAPSGPRGCLVSLKPGQAVPVLSLGPSQPPCYRSAQLCTARPTSHMQVTRWPWLPGKEHT